jgi:hypothetical protein
MTGHGQWGLLVTAVNEGGIPTILAQEHCAQPYASTPSIPDSRAPEPDGDIVRRDDMLSRLLP